jgi:hypothetical protein
MEGGKKGGTNSRNLGGKFFSSAGNISFPALFRFRSSQLTGKGRGIFDIFPFISLILCEGDEQPLLQKRTGAATGSSGIGGLEVGIETGIGGQGVGKRFRDTVSEDRRKV